MTRLILLVAYVICCVWTVAGNDVGGFGEERKPTDNDKTIAAEIRAKVGEIVGQNYAIFDVISVRSQVVAGTNYIMKILVDGKDYIHVKVFVALPGEHKPPQVTDVQTGKKKEDPLN